MHFPTYVCDPKLTDDQRASARLRFLLDRAGMHLTGKRSLRGLSRAIEMNHSSIITAIQQGRCSAEMALRIEEACGRRHTNNEWLRRPLDIPSE